MKKLILATSCMIPGLAYAASDAGQRIDLTSHFVGYLALGLFLLSILLVMTEEYTHLRKSKPVMLAAGFIWACIAFIYIGHDDTHMVENAARHNLLEYAELMLFLLVAMTYITTMTERRVFDTLRIWLIQRGFGFKKLFWLTGALSFCLSPIADNLTAALFIFDDVVSIAKVNVLGTFILIFCNDKAPLSGIFIVIGVKSRNL